MSRAAESGQFSVAFWFKANASDQSGDLFGYMFSDTAYDSLHMLDDHDTFYHNRCVSLGSEN